MGADPDEVAVSRRRIQLTASDVLGRVLSMAWRREKEQHAAQSPGYTRNRHLERDRSVCVYDPAKLGIAPYLHMKEGRLKFSEATKALRWRG